MHARRLGALRLRSATIFCLCNDCVHFRHDLVMGNARARVIERGLHLGAKPAVIAGSLFFGFEFRDDRGEDSVHSGRLHQFWPQPDIGGKRSALCLLYVGRKVMAGYVNVATCTPAISHYRAQLNSLTLLWACFGLVLRVLWACFGLVLRVLWTCFRRSLKCT